MNAPLGRRAQSWQGDRSRHCWLGSNSVDNPVAIFTDQSICAKSRGRSCCASFFGRLRFQTIANLNSKIGLVRVSPWFH
jgi:hypothetical protein